MLPAQSKSVILVFFPGVNTDVMFLFEMLILPEKLIANFLALLTAFTAGLKLR